MKRKFAILFLIVCATLSIVACTAVQNSQSSSDGSVNESISEESEHSSNSVIDSSIEQSSESNDESFSSSSEQIDSSVSEDSEKSYAIRLYHAYDEYTVVEYEEGELVEVSAWPTPNGILFEGDSIPFVGWYDEWLENLVTEDFEMPAHSMAFYASYDMPQLFGWSYDAESKSYTSSKAGIRPAKDAEKGYYGNLSVTLDINVATTSGIGIIWNLDYNKEIDYPYDTNCEYWYFHLNPTTGGFQLAKVKGDYLVAKTVSKTASPEAWQEKWSNWRIFGGTLTTEFSVEFTPDYIKLYVDGDLLYTYAGDWLNTVVGDSVGIRTNTAGNGARNITFTPTSYSNDTHVVTYVNGLTGETIDRRLAVNGNELYLPNIAEEGYAFVGWFADEQLTEKVESDWYVSEDTTIYASLVEVESANGYNIYPDGTYESVVKNATATVPGLGGRYGKWSVDITVTDRENNRLGLLINAYVPHSSGAILYGNEAINGYYVHHNVKANVNFTLTSFTKGEYGGRPDGSNAGLVVQKYDASATGKIGEYRARNAAFVAGETDSLTFNLAVEVLNTYIKVYVDGELYIEYTNATGLGMFDDDATCIGVGFTTSTIGTKFANYTFTPMQAEEVKPTETYKNGYMISPDGKTYTSTELRAATTVDGITGRYGKWSADVTITSTGNSRVGLYINAYVPTSDSLVRYDNKSIKCYYLHHSASSNVNFTLTSINNGIYQGRPDGSEKNIQVVKYNADTEGTLGEYYARNAAFHAGETDSLSMNLAIEVMPTYIKIYVDGECIYTCTNEADLGLFDGDAQCVGVGFNTYQTGTTFTNFVFTPYEQ